MTRPPPHRSRRAVFPHRALQTASRPPSGRGRRSDPSPCRAPDEARPFDRHVAEPFGNACPRVTPPLAAAIQPRAQDPSGPGDARLPARIVALHAIGAVIPPPFGVQVLAHVPPPTTPRVPTPGGDRLARVPPLLARRAALPLGRAHPLGAPAHLTAADVNTGAAPGVLPPARDHPGLVRCHLPSTLAPPWPPLLLAALGRRLLWTGGHDISRGSAQAGLALTAGLAPLLNPPGEGLVPSHGGQEGRADAAWRRPCRRVEPLAVGVQHAGREPCPHPPPHRAVLPAFLEPPEPPVVRDVVTAPLDVRFDPDVVRPTWARARPLVHRGPGPDRGPRPLATAPDVRRVDRFADPRDRAWPPRVFPGGSPQRTAVPVACRDLRPRAALGAVAVPLPSRPEVLPVRLERWRVGFGADVIDAIRRVLADGAPALAELRLLEPLLEGANPRRRWRSGRRRSPRHAG